MEEKKNEQEQSQEVTTATQGAEGAGTETTGEAGGAEDAEGTEGTGEQNPKSRDLFYERIRTNFPDSNYDEDEDGYYRDALSRMDELESDSKNFKNLSAKLSARLDKDPREAEVMLDWLDGMDIRTAITRHMGAEALAVPEEGSEEFESWKKAGDERRQELETMKSRVDEYRSNAEASANDLNALAQENGWSDEEKAEVEKYISGILDKVYSGRLDKDFYNGILKSRNYDADVEGAREQGRVEGRNEKIEAEKKHLAGSGLPSNGAGGGASEEVDATPKGNKTVDFLAKMAKRRV